MPSIVAMAMTTALDVVSSIDHTSSQAMREALAETKQFLWSMMLDFQNLVMTNKIALLKNFT